MFLLILEGQKVKCPFLKLPRQKLNSCGRKVAAVETAAWEAPQ